MADECFQTLLRECVGDEISATVPITDLAGLAALGANKKIALMGVKLKSKDPAKIATITGEEWTSLKKFLWGVSHIQKFHPRFKYVQ